MSGPSAEFRFELREKPGVPALVFNKVRSLFRKDDPFPELKRAYTVSFSSGGNVQPSQRSSSLNTNDIPQLKRRLADMLVSAISKNEVNATADQLHRFLFADREFDAAFDRSLRTPNEPSFDREIQISADEDSLPLLANLPWEIARDTWPGDQVQERSLLGTLAAYPIVRAIPRQSAPAVPQERVRVQCCIANYKGEVIQFDAAAFAQTVRDSLTKHVDPFYVTAANDQPTFQQTTDEIDNVEPHIFIFVGHGKSHRGIPQLRFERWVDVKEFAQHLAKSGKLLLAILIACDQTRIVRAPAAQSGALTLIHHRIPSVVAMQGYVDPGRAKAFLQAFMHNLFITHSIAKAAAKGRIAMEVPPEGERWTSDWVLPTVFRGVSKEQEAEQLRVVLGHHQPALERLLTFVRPVPIHLRRPTLESQLAKFLTDGTGLLQISGGIGVGKTQLIRRVTREQIQEAIDNRSPLARPIFYVDLDDYDESSTRERWFLSKLESRFADVRALLSKSTFTTIMSKEWATAELAGVLRAELDHSGMVLIIDHLRNDNTGFWTELTRQAVDLKNSLLIMVGPAAGVLPSTQNNVDVPSFDVEETKRYVQQFVNGDMDLAHEWYERSGGNALLLDGLRAVNKSSVIKVPTDILSRKQERVATEYIELIKHTLTDQEIATLCAFYWIPGLLEAELAHRFMPGDNTFDVLNSLVEKGVLIKTEKSDKQWLSLARLKADGLSDADTQRAALDLIDRFNDEILLIDNSQEALDALAAKPGATALLKGVQSAYLASGEIELAMELASVLTTAFDDNAFQRYEFLVSVLHPKPDIHVPDSVWVKAAGTARRVGELDKACSFLAELNDQKLSKDLYADVLNIKAMIMKDRGQSKKRDEILAYYAEAIIIAEAGIRGEITDNQRTPDEWSDLLLILLYNRSAILQFFAGLQSDALNDIRRVQELAKQRDPVFAAAAKAQEVDILLSRPKLITDWPHLLNLLQDAYGTLTKAQSADHLPYCCYQYARFHRHRPAQSKDHRVQYLRAAARFYDEAAKTAAEFGDFKRRAAAIEHWVKVAWRELGGQPDAISDQQAASKLDEFLPALQEYRGDAYAARILRDTLFLRAEIENTINPARHRELLKAACLASVDPTLNPSEVSDDRRRGMRIFIHYLESLQFINDAVEAESFIAQHRELISTWLDDKLPEQPWETLTKLKEKETSWAT